MSKGREEVARLLADEVDTAPMPSVEACLSALQELVVWEEGRWLLAGQSGVDVTAVVGELLPCPETDRERADRLSEEVRRWKASSQAATQSIVSLTSQLRAAEADIANLKIALGVPVGGEG